MTAKTIAVTTLAVAACVPLIATIWLHLKRRDLSHRVTVSTSVDTNAPSEDEIKSLPSKLYDAPHEWVLSIERASKVGKASELPSNAEVDELIVRYLRANMTSFTYTPQAPLLRRMCAREEDKATFDAAYLGSLGFEVGERVCGVFVVVERGKGRIEMATCPPDGEGWRGPKGAEGRVVARVERRGGECVFTNGESI